MIKSLLFVTFLLGFSPAFAGPDDGPIFPWPTGIETRELVAEDIAGDWLGYSGLETYYIHFEADEDTSYRVRVLVKPVNKIDDGKTRVGLGYWGRHVFWGHISMDGERYTQMVIFRDQGILKMRIERPFKEGYFDMNLTRWPWGKPL